MLLDGSLLILNLQLRNCWMIFEPDEQEEQGPGEGQEQIKEDL